MPGMDGREVFHRLRAVSPNVKVIISSGYSRDQDADDLLKLGLRASYRSLTRSW